MIILTYKEPLVSAFKTFQRQRTISSRSSKKIRIKELPVPIISKPQRTSSFHERSSEELVVLWAVIFLKMLRTMVTYQNQLLIFLRAMVLNPKNHMTTYQMSVPICSNHPIWVLMWIYLIRIEKSPFSHFREGKTRFTLLHYCVLFEGHSTCQIDRTNRLGMHRCSFFSNRLQTYTC